MLYNCVIDVIEINWGFYYIFCYCKIFYSEDMLSDRVAYYV